LLTSGTRQVLKRNINNMDAVKLTQATWIPRFVWFAGWLTIAVVSLWGGTSAARPRLTSPGSRTN